MIGEILRVDKEDDGKLYTHINLEHGYSYQALGLLIADIIRHVGIAFSVPADDVHEWVKKELASPTTDIKEIMVQ